MFRQGFKPISQIFKTIVSYISLLYFPSKIQFRENIREIQYSIKGGFHNIILLSL